MLFRDYAEKAEFTEHPRNRRMNEGISRARKFDYNVKFRDDSTHALYDPIVSK